MISVNGEIESVQRKINERLVAYDQIKCNLDEIGAKQQRTEKLNNQMRELNNQLEQSAKIKRDCQEAEHDLKEEIYHVKSDLEGYISSFENITRLMESDEYQFKRLLSGILASVGFVLGSFLGTGIAPVAGTVAGGIAGAWLGASLTGGSDHELIVSKYNESIKNGKKLQKELKDIIDE